MLEWWQVGNDPKIIVLLSLLLASFLLFLLFLLPLLLLLHLLLLLFLLQLGFEILWSLYWRIGSSKIRLLFQMLLVICQEDWLFRWDDWGIDRAESIEMKSLLMFINGGLVSLIGALIDQLAPNYLLFRNMVVICCTKWRWCDEMIANYLLTISILWLIPLLRC